MPISDLLNATLLLTGLLVAGFFLLEWRRERRFQFRHQMESEERRRAEERELREQQLAIEEQRRKEQQEREEMRRYEERIQREEESLRQAVGPGSGGYIIIDLPQEKRPLFHDLLKGFEEYARLKGYSVSFSVDSTYQDKIAFKFTINTDSVNVGPDRVRRDFQDYIDRVQSGDDLADLPVITSIEEHNLLVTILRNRISFLQHSYNLQKNAVDFYQRLLRNLPAGAVVSPPNLIVQTGGLMDSRRYISNQSSKLIQGDANTNTDQSVDASVTIGGSFNERRGQIEALARLITELKKDGSESVEKDGVVRHFERVKDELEDQTEPDRSRVRQWLDRAKTSIEALKLGKDTLQLINEVLTSFGVGPLAGS